MANEPSAVSRDYFAGLFDANGRVRLSPRKAEQRYINHQFQYEVVINDNQSDALIGLVAAFLESENIEYNIKAENRSSRCLSIKQRASIEHLADILKGRLIARAEQLAFLADAVLPALEQGEMQGPREFYAAMLSFAELKPQIVEHESRKYTPEFFRDYFDSRFDIDFESVEPLNAPEVSLPEDPPIEYFAGLFDTCGRFIMKVSRNAEYDIGYALSMTFDLRLSHASAIFTGYIQQFFNRNSINYNYSEYDSRSQITISSANELEKLIEILGPHLYTKYPQAEFLYGQGLPAYRDGYHHTKQGFYELLAAFEETSIRDIDTSKKYTSEFFAKKWTNEIEEFD